MSYHISLNFLTKNFYFIIYVKDNLVKLHVSEVTVTKLGTCVGVLRC